MNRENKILIIYVILWISIWGISNILTFGIKSIIPWLVIIFGYLFGVILSYGVIMRGWTFCFHNYIKTSGGRNLDETDYCESLYECNKRM